MDKNVVLLKHRNSVSKSELERRKYVLKFHGFCCFANASLNFNEWSQRSLIKATMSLSSSNSKAESILVEPKEKRNKLSI